MTLCWGAVPAGTELRHLRWATFPFRAVGFPGFLQTGYLPTGAVTLSTCSPSGCRFLALLHYNTFLSLSYFPPRSLNVMFKVSLYWLICLFCFGLFYDFLGWEEERHFSSLLHLQVPRPCCFCGFLCIIPTTPQVFCCLRHQPSLLFRAFRADAFLTIDAAAAVSSRLFLIASISLLQPHLLTHAVHPSALSSSLSLGSGSVIWYCATFD